MPKKYEAIIFDLGGVLYDIDVTRTVDAFAALGVPGFNQYYTLQNQTGLIDRFEKGQLNQEAFTEGVNQLIGREFSTDQVRNAWNALLIGLPAQSVELLHDLKQKGYQIYLLSNTNAFHMEAINQEVRQKYGIPSLASLVDKAWYSFEMNMRKPDAEIYEKVMRENGLNPQTTVFIDDNQDNILSAEKAGMPAMHKPGDRSIQDLLTDMGIG